jgi:glycosyltransferase involved in cell wall biosynthesis
MFGWEFPPHNSGGLGTACFGLTRGLAQIGVPVTFVLPKKVSVDGAPVDMAFASDGGDTVSVRGIDALLTPYRSAREYDRVRADFGADDVYAGNLYAEVARYGERARLLARQYQGVIDVVHAHDWLSFPAGIAAAEELGVPLVTHVHATEYDRTGGNGINQHVYEIERQGIEYADTVISVSGFTKRYLVDRYGAPEGKVVPVHNGIEAEDYTEDKVATDRVVHLKDQGHPIVLFVGRLTLQKGPDYFVEAAKRIHELVPEARFVFAGSGDMERRLIREVAAAGISDAFIFAGFVRGAPLATLYKAADVFIMPSVSEPFGITPLESLINGTPAIVSKQSGVSEILANALRVDFWDIDEIVNKTVSVLSRDSLHSTLRDNGYHEVHTHTWKTAAEKVRRVYDIMMSSKEE